MPNEVFHKGSNYIYHFISFYISKRGWRTIWISWRKQRKVQKFSVPIKKEIAKIDKDDNESVTTIFYKIKFIDSARLMASSLSNLADDLIEGIHKIKCKDCDCFLEYKSVEDNLIKYKCLSFNKDYSNKLDYKLKKKFKKTFQFSNNDINKFILLFRKVVYPYEYIDIGKSLMKQHYLKRKNFIVSWILEKLQT